MRGKVFGPKCISCEHCTDEFYDSDGPYMWLCDKQEMVDDKLMCTLYNEDIQDKNNWEQSDWSTESEYDDLSEDDRKMVDNIVDKAVGSVTKTLKDDFIKIIKGGPGYEKI